MKKVRIRNQTLVYPLPCVLLGSLVDGKPNFSAVGNCAIVSVEPPVLMVSSEREHHTNLGIRQTGAFSVNIAGAAQAAMVDWCGLYSGRDVDKAADVASETAQTLPTPMAADCPISMACRVVHSFELHDMEVFIGAVEETTADETTLERGVPNAALVDPLAYTMDNRYYRMGEALGFGFHIGKDWQAKSSAETRDNP